jgi:hypothetical protein
VRDWTWPLLLVVSACRPSPVVTSSDEFEKA